MRRLTRECVARLARAYYGRCCPGGRFVTDKERESWTDVEGWHGEDYLERDPQGRVWYLNPDAPAHGVDVSDIPLEYEGDV